MKIGDRLASPEGRVDRTLAEILALLGEEVPISGTQMRTASGIWFDLARPRKEDVCIQDIAAQTSKLCRFCGATKNLYSIAEHGVFVMRLIERDLGKSELAFAGLMHDAHEAFLGDLISPLKRICPSLFRAIEKPIQKAVMDAFEIPWDDSIEACVKKYDLDAYRSEDCELLPECNEEREWGDVRLILNHDIVPYLPKAAEIEFLRNFRNYRQLLLRPTK